MDDYLQQGILAAKAGDKPRAFDLLMHACEVPETSEKAWLWLSSVVNDDAERLFCMNSVLRINPANSAAQRGAEILRQKGIFPSVPVYPEPPKAPLSQNFATKQGSGPTSSYTNFSTPSWTQTASAATTKSTSAQPLSSQTDWQKQELSGLYKYAVMELANKKSRQTVEKLLVGRGVSLESARMIVKDSENAVRKLKREKAKQRMKRGFVWTLIGVIITCGTLAFSDNLGGRYVLFYGAIVFGLIDFIAGLFGWLFN